MKRWIVVLLVVLVLTSIYGARHFGERRRQTNIVRHDAQWFTEALKTGNKHVAAVYLARPKMDAASLEKALRFHAQSLLTTDFEVAPVSFRLDGSTPLATFDCTGGAVLAFYTDDGGDVWRVSELKAK